jgi:hypothetical protein
MSDDIEEKALDLIRRLNRLNTDLAFCISRQHKYEHSDSEYWEKQGSRLRTRIKEVERTIQSLKVEPGLTQEMKDRLYSYAEENGWSESMYEIVLHDINNDRFKTMKELEAYMAS